MKKTALFLIMTLTIGLIQAQKKYQLNSMVAESGGETMLYFYNDQQKVDSTWSESIADKLTLSQKFIYNNKGQLVRIKGYQILDGDDFFTNTIRIDYTYDEQGRIASRVNYNRDPYGYEYLRGGTYEYIYGEDGFLKTRNGYWDEARKKKFERAEYSFNTDGSIKSENMFQINSAGETYISGADYKYSKDGKLVLKMLKALNRNINEPYYCGGEQFTYNEAGDVIEWVKYSTSPSDPSQKGVFTYTDLHTTDIVFPINPESTNEVALNSVHGIAQDSVYTMDMQTGILMLYDVFNYSYASAKGSEITNPFTAKELLWAYIANDKVFINGVKDGEIIRIYDASGNLLKQNNYRPEGIDMAAMPSGIYCVASPNGTIKIYKE